LKRSTMSFYGCNVCNVLASEYGRPYRMLLSKDSVYLSFLMASQRLDIPYEEPTRVSKCHPWSKTSLLMREFEYPAAVSIFVSGIKFLDDRHDEGSFQSRALCSILQRKIRSAEQRLHELGLSLPPIEKLIQQQHAREALPGRELNYYSQMTEEIYSKIISHTATLAGVPANAAPLAEAGLHVGRLAYLLDNCLDSQNDSKKGHSTQPTTIQDNW